ncbi:hypothetical protein EDC01DRAFT_784940 [Geopyxis carbonaria]|nr:hypothetical protein EDC01DRAFT_784940 [Geopyxis carbonaria]
MPLLLPPPTVSRRLLRRVFHAAPSAALHTSAALHVKPHIFRNAHLEAADPDFKPYFYVPAPTDQPLGQPTHSVQRYKSTVRLLLLVQCSPARPSRFLGLREEFIGMHLKVDNAWHPTIEPELCRFVAKILGVNQDQVRVVPMDKSWQAQTLSRLNGLNRGAKYGSAVKVVDVMGVDEKWDKHEVMYRMNEDSGIFIEKGEVVDKGWYSPGGFHKDQDYPDYRDKK